MPLDYRNGTAAFALLRGRRRGTALRARRSTPSRSPAFTLPTDSRFGGGGWLQIVRPSFAWSQTQLRGQVVSGGGTSHPPASRWRDEARQACSFWSIGDIARGFHREHVMAWGRSGLVSPVPRATAGRGVANQTAEFFETNRGGPIWSTGCRIRFHHRQHRSRIGAARNCFGQPDAGSSEKTPTGKVKECPPAGLEERVIHLVSKAGESAFLRPPDARVLSRRPEISAHRSRRREWSDDSKPRVVRLGCSVREQCHALAVSWKRGVAISNGFKFAAAFCTYLAKRQWFASARKIRGECATAARGGRVCEKVKRYDFA